MSIVFDSSTCELDYSVIDPAKVVLSGAPGDSRLETGFAEGGSTDKLRTGVWTHPVGVSTDVEVDEVFVVIAGKGRVVLKDGRVLHLFPGVVGTLIAGEETRWEIDETLKKVWIVAK